MMSEAISTPRRERLELSDAQKQRKLLLMIAGVMLLAALPFVRSVADFEAPLHRVIDGVGRSLIVAAIFGRTWCALYIGGRKSKEIVATGPYSISRNPLYMFSLLAILGIGLQSGSVTVGLVAFCVGVLIFARVISREEQALAAMFGDFYAAYIASVPRFGPNFALWRDVDLIAANPRTVRKTFFEALLLLLSLPLCEMIEKLQESGLVVPLLHLP